MSGKFSIRRFAVERLRSIRLWPHRFYDLQEYLTTRDRRYVNPYAGMVKCDGVQKLLTVPEACQALRISKPALYRLIQSGQLGSMKLNHRRLIPQKALRPFIAEIRAQEGVVK